MSTASEPIASRPRPAPPRLNLLPEPPPASPRPSPWVRLPVLLGLGLLGASIFAAIYLRPSTGGDPAADGKAPPGGPTAAAPVVVCHGAVDVDGQIRHLTPAQLGEVVEVAVTEGQQVKEGDVLLRVSEEPARLAIAQAEAGVRAAEAQVAQARQGIEQLRLGLEKQQSAIDAAQAKLAAAEAQLRRLEGLRKENLTNENDLSSARNTVNALRAALAAEQTEYRRIQALQPEDKLREAQAGLDLARERLQAERYKLDQCTRRAPCDGTVLRINVAKGSIITPQMRQAPILFSPTGPRIVRAEMLPEFATRVVPGMPATIHDESNSHVVWHGKVQRLADAYLPRRPTGSESLSLSGNDSLLLECIIELEPTATPPRIGQRVRVALGGQ